MPGRHQKSAEYYRPSLTDYPVGQHAAEERSHVGKGGVEPINLRGKGLGSEWAKNRFECSLNHAKTEYPLSGLSIPEKVVDHVEDEQRTHTVIGKTLPHFGEEEHEQAGGMAQNRSAGCNTCRRIVQSLHYPSFAAPGMFWDGSITRRLFVIEMYRKCGCSATTVIGGYSRWWPVRGSKQGDRRACVECGKAL